jgi:hypothetical protein
MFHGLMSNPVLLEYKSELDYLQQVNFEIHGTNLNFHFNNIIKAVHAWR